MANSKIEFKIGNIKFIGDGEQEWLSKQLDKILNKIPELINYDIPESNVPDDNGLTNEISEPQKQEKSNSSSKIKETLATFLRSKKGTANQRRKYLATAVYLQLNGNESMTSKDVTDALLKAKQTKLTNAANELNQNVKQGYCERHGKTFYVTPEGISKIMG